jgi:tetratricopeptide (TPR) repeat protein
MYLAERPHADLEAFELGMTHFQSGDREQARQQWRVLLERSPRYVPALYFSGLVEAQEGRAEDARRYLDALLRCAPAADPYAARGARLLNDIEAFASPSGPEVSPPGRSGWVPADHPAGRQG